MSSADATLPPLLRLPAEIRLLIYDNLNIAHVTPISIYDASTDPPPIGRTCRLLREQSMDCYFRRTRFTISSLMGLSAALRRVMPQNVSRMTHLRLAYRGWEPEMHSRVKRLVEGGKAYLDIDLLDTEPWFRVSSHHVDLAATECEAALPLYASQKGTWINARYFANPAARLRLLPVLMEATMASIQRAMNGRPIEFNSHMLEYIAQWWLWNAHLLVCGQRGSCASCERALGWLSV